MRVLSGIWRKFNRSTNFIITRNKKEKIESKCRIPTGEKLLKTIQLSLNMSSMICIRDQDFIFKIYLLSKKSFTMYMYTSYGSSRNIYVTTENLECAIIWVGFKCNVFDYELVASASRIFMT